MPSPLTAEAIELAFREGWQKGHADAIAFAMLVVCGDNKTIRNGSNLDGDWLASAARKTAIIVGGTLEDGE